MPLVQLRDEEYDWFLICVDRLTVWTVGRPSLKLSLTCENAAHLMLMCIEEGGYFGRDKNRSRSKICERIFVDHVFTFTGLMHFFPLSLNFYGITQFNQIPMDCWKEPDLLFVISSEESRNQKRDNGSLWFTWVNFQGLSSSSRYGRFRHGFSPYQFFFGLKVQDWGFIL